MADSPKYTDNIYTVAKPRLDLMADATGGVETIRKEVHIEKFPAESDTWYKQRVRQAEYNNAVNETIDTAVGKLFRKSIKFDENTPQELIDWANDVDGSGTTLNEYAKQEMKHAIRDGLTYAFIDVPYVDGIETMTNAQKQALGINLTPRVSHVRFVDVINRYVDASGKLTKCTIVESVTRLKNGAEFEQETVKQYRVLYIEGGEVYQDVWEEYDSTTGDKLVKTALDGNGNEIKMQRITPSNNAGEKSIKLVEIPLVPLYTGKIAAHNAKPPLLNQAYTLFSWINTNSQYQRALQDTADPTLLAVGRQPDENGKYKPLITGTRTVIDVPEGGSAEWLELTGQSLPSFITKLERLEAELESYKTSIQAKDASVSTKQTSIENADKVSKLTNWAWNIEDYINGILKIVGAYMGVEYDVKAECNKDFDEYELSKENKEFLSQMEQRGQFPLKRMLMLLKRGEVIPDEWDIEEIMDELSSQPPA